MQHNHQSSICQACKTGRGWVSYQSAKLNERVVYCSTIKICVNLTSNDPMGNVPQ